MVWVGFIIFDKVTHQKNTSVMPINILATADLHLGRKSSALPPEAGQHSTRHTWKRLVDYAIRHQVDVLLLAGDIVDEDNRYFEATGPLQSGFSRLEQEGIEVFMIAGNHDFAVLEQIIHHHSYEHVHLMGADGSWEKTTRTIKGQEIQLAGWSFTHKHVREDPMAGFDRLDLNPGQITIGLLHGDLYTPDSLYAPVTSAQLESKPVDAWIMGHIHKPADIKPEKPYIAYTGTPHALNPGEPGVHGPVLLTVESKENIQAQRIPLSPIRYELLEVDVSQTEDLASFREQVTRQLWDSAQDLLPWLEQVAWLIYDVHLVGESSHLNNIGSWMDQMEDYSPELSTGTQVSIRKAISHVKPAAGNLHELASHPSPAGQLAQTILTIENGESSDFLEVLTEQWQQYVKRLNHTSTYLPLHQENRVFEGTREEARNKILSESRRMLSELLAQQEK